MSKFTKPQLPVHIPSFEKYSVNSNELMLYLTSNIPDNEFISNVHIQVPALPLDGTYWYTDGEGWAKLLPDLLLKSNLYKPDTFDCDNFALKVMSTCAERYGLNGMFVIVGNVPGGRHAWNGFVIRTTTGYFYEILFFEPNEGFGHSYQPFEIGEYNYIPDLAIL